MCEFTSFLVSKVPRRDIEHAARRTDFSAASRALQCIPTVGHANGVRSRSPARVAPPAFGTRHCAWNGWIYVCGGRYDFTLNPSCCSTPITRSLCFPCISMMSSFKVPPAPQVFFSLVSSAGRSLPTAGNPRMTVTVLPFLRFSRRLGRSDFRVGSAEQVVADIDSSIRVLRTGHNEADGAIVCPQKVACEPPTSVTSRVGDNDQRDITLASINLRMLLNLAE